ncbi:NAD(P)H-dependent glycerol-3-phosphate dehydrogenase [Bartonella sp. LJL80]
MTKSKKIAVMGSGAWGTALAAMARRLGHNVALYGRDVATIDGINNQHINARYLPGITLPDDIRATTDPAKALADADLVLGVIPAQSFGSALAEFSAFIPRNAPLILCAKGIERETGRFMSDVAEDLLPHHDIAALSGPSFADDVARGLPTAVTIAARNLDLAHDLAALLSGPVFRCYSSDDLIGVEIGGALKNVLALAAGAASGRGLGASAQAALVTRGFAELRRVGQAMGAKAETMTGLSVLGDLILTCSSPQSRNFSYGSALGAGKPTQGLKLAEGVATAPIAAKLCHDKNIDAPIIEAVAALLDRRLTIDHAVTALITRPLKPED